jgi:putative endonuclease
MSFWVYILYSQNSEKFYCGYTSDLPKRIEAHNNPQKPGAKTTHNFPGPWLLAWSIEFENKKDAMKKERNIKNIGIKRFLERQKVKQDSGC